MVLTRRQSIAAIGSAVVGLLAQPVGWTDDKRPREDYRDFYTGEIPDLQLFGTGNPTKKEVDHAESLILAAPHRKPPLTILQYFASISDLNDDKEEYRGGWRDRWNPIIVRFFQETQTKPSGDTTPWCAAFINWLLARSGRKGTNSAASGSFREAPGKTVTPVPGDIVVFSSSDPVQAAALHGHVGLYLRQDASRIQVLGGNQVNEVGHHKICEEWIHKNRPGSSLAFHSYHSMTAFPFA